MLWRVGKNDGVICIDCANAAVCPTGLVIPGEAMNAASSEMILHDYCTRTMSCNRECNFSACNFSLASFPGSTPQLGRRPGNEANFSLLFNEHMQEVDQKCTYVP